MLKQNFLSVNRFVHVESENRIEMNCEEEKFRMRLFLTLLVFIYFLLYLLLLFHEVIGKLFNFYFVLDKGYKKNFFYFCFLLRGQNRIYIQNN